MEEKKTGTLILNRTDKENRNVILIDNKLKITIKKISGKTVTLAFTPLEGYSHIKRGELK